MEGKSAPSPGLRRAIGLIKDERAIIPPLLQKASEMTKFTRRPPLPVVFSASRFEFSTERCGSPACRAYTTARLGVAAQPRSGLFFARLNEKNV